MTESDQNPADELRDLDRQIDEVGNDLAGITDQLADAGALDSEERAAVLTNRAELEGVLEGLHNRRETVRAQLDAG